MIIIRLTRALQVPCKALDNKRESFRPAAVLSGCRGSGVSKPGASLSCLLRKLARVIGACLSREDDVFLTPE